MLSISHPDDIALTLYDYGEPDPLFDVEAVKSIASKIGRRHVFGHLDVGIVRHISAMVYQTYHLTAGASLWVSKDPNIKEVWYGLKRGDPTPNIANDHWRCMNAWSIMHPNVPFYAPLIACTERQQWDMIPHDVRPLVRNCLFGTDCGTCRKCVKLKNMPGSFWQVT